MPAARRLMLPGHANVVDNIFANWFQGGVWVKVVVVDCNFSFNLLIGTEVGRSLLQYGWLGAKGKLAELSIERLLGGLAIGL